MNYGCGGRAPAWRSVVYDRHDLMSVECLLNGEWRLAGVKLIEQRGSLDLITQPTVCSSDDDDRFIKYGAQWPHSS